MPKKDLDCLDRFYVAVMNVTLGLVLFLIAKLFIYTMGETPLYLYSVMDPQDHWPVIEYQVHEGEKLKGNYTPPGFLTSQSTQNRVVEFYAVRTNFQWVLFQCGSVGCPDMSHDANSLNSTAYSHGVLIVNISSNTISILHEIAPLWPKCME